MLRNHIYVLAMIVGASLALALTMPASFSFGAEAIIIPDDIAEDSYADPFPNLPPIRTWTNPHYQCEDAQNPPEGWRRPGGYCDQISSTKSLIYTGTWAGRTYQP